MTTDIQAQIEQRPHLKEPFELYEKWQRFQLGAAEILQKSGSEHSPFDSRSYQREAVGPVFQLFASIFNLSGEQLAPLRLAIEEGKIDFMRLPVDGLPDLALPYDEDELAPLLFLLSRPYFIALKNASPMDELSWEGGRCPICSAPPAIASITEGPRRLLHCSWCTTSGSYRFMGCPSCGTNDTSKLSTLASDEEPGFRVATCDACSSYVKIVEGSVLTGMKPDLADLASLPLDIVAQQKEYIRKAPNPIGLLKMK